MTCEHHWEQWKQQHISQILEKKRQKSIWGNRGCKLPERSDGIDEYPDPRTSMNYSRVDSKEPVWGLLLSDSQKPETKPEFLNQQVRNTLSCIGIVNMTTTTSLPVKTWVSEAMWWHLKLRISSRNKLSFTAKQKPDMVTHGFSPHTQKFEEDGEPSRNTTYGNLCPLHVPSHGQPTQNRQMHKWKGRNHSCPRIEYKAKCLKLSLAIIPWPWLQKHSQKMKK